MAVGSDSSERPGVFLAFVREDATHAVHLDAALRACGARTAFDESREFENGLPSEVVLQDLGACDAFVSLSSQHAADDADGAELRRLAESFGKPCFVALLEEDDQEIVAAIYRLLGMEPQEVASRPPLAVEPGRWRITSDAQHGETLDLRLTADPDVASPSAGRLTGTHRRASLEGTVTGTWRCSSEDASLDLELESSFGLRPQRTLRRLQLLSGTGRELTAEDLHGIATVLRYRLVRTDDR